MAAAREKIALPPDAKQEALQNREVSRVPKREQQIVLDVRAERGRRGFAEGEGAKMKNVLKDVRGKNILEKTKALALAGIVAFTTGVALRVAREHIPAHEKQKLSSSEMQKQTLDRYNKNPDVVDAILKWKQRNPELADKIQDIKIVGVEQKKDLGKREIQGVGVLASEHVLDIHVQLSVALKGGKEIPISTIVRASETPQDNLHTLLDRAVPSTQDASNDALRRALEQGLASIEKDKIL